MESLSQALPRTRPFQGLAALWGDVKRRVAIARLDARLRGELKY
jgi:hypothetical protein